MFNIFKITPNSIHRIIKKDKNKLIIQAEFYSNNLPGIYGFLAKVIHFWDIQIANRFAPNLNLGFDSLIANPNTGEGRVYMLNNATWAGARDAATGDATNGAVDIQSNGGANYTNVRAFFPFDTSSLPDTAIISAANFQYYANVIVNTDTTTAVLVVQTQASNTSLAVEDYDQVAFIAKATVALSAITTSAYNTFTISDLTTISTTGHTKFALITGRDLANSQPTGDNIMTGDNRGAANPPKLTVTYTVGGNTSSRMMRGLGT